MPKLTVIILTRNEERNLNACLESLRDLGDEIIVLDSSSEDRTCDIAKSRGARVFEAPPSVQGFGQRRRYAVMKAKNDVVLHLDADERLSAEGVAELKQAVAAMERTTVIALPRLTYLFATAAGFPTLSCAFTIAATRISQRRWCTRMWNLRMTARW